ncbi:aminotransferase class IV [Aestuariimicrobium sp. T2.26MG-19.2B]|uniref:aminotransferase class IV n=1 Tax=Aestuariimicrobium sp. T2.26MG-19.2B TaxID=3040679 RepID=UPI0024775C24|nr:aminotransferase class IV [Aestuariimicrobium sp. T2.26MG-19.2B]CAI9404079.1 D-alanine aminotransferase [Aestuariimicrobium sp. T2.26MG-19.2B]
MTTQLVGVVGRGLLAPDSPHAREPKTAPGQVISVDDLGFTRGDGVFDATRVVTADDGSSSVDHLDRHLARFARSVAGMDGDPLDEGPWRELIGQAVEAWTTPGEAVLKIMWTRGLESSTSEPTQVLTITPLSEGAIRLREGIAVALMSRGTSSDAYRDARWLLGGVKTLSYGINMAVKREAARRGCDEVLLTSTDGWVMEGPNASLVTLHLDGGRPVLRSTPVEGTGILRSITQEVLFERAASEGVATELVLQTPEEVKRADAAWYLSSVRGAARVTRFDEHPVAGSDEWTARIRGWISF